MSSVSKMNILYIPGVVGVKTKVVGDGLVVVVVAVGICIVGVGTGHGYELLSIVPFFPQTAVRQLPCPSVVL